MNREILFRGISLDTQKWIEGYGVIVMPETKESFIIHKQGQNIHQHTEVIPSTVGQFTGLTDKNGTKIFEGDQYETDSWPGIEFTIKFVNGSFCGGTEGYGYDPMGYTINQESETIELDNFASTITITGTIHDNPTP